jgi:ubiquinol-cytochrome c reductase cytochrome c1 subunit
VGSTHTVDEAKAMAEENEYDTEPNDEGDIAAWKALGLYS